MIAPRSGGTSMGLKDGVLYGRPVFEMGIVDLETYFGMGTRGRV